jgi:multidrug resistance protein, MATE family
LELHDLTMDNRRRALDLAAEMRAMATLAWPMVLTNLAQNAMQTTDVVMMGWLGPEALAAGTLGFNIYFTPMIFGMGLLLSVSPMVAFEIGRRAHSVRDVRRTVRQGLWIALMVAIPLWALMWHGEAILVAMGQDPAVGGCGRLSARHAMGAPALLFLMSCCAPSSPRWSGPAGRWPSWRSPSSSTPSPTGC